METPSSREEAGEVMRAAGAAGRTVRIRGGGTKSSWGRPVDPPDVEVSTERLDRIVEHNEGDLTAVFEAGVPLARAQEALAEADQMVALDPPLGVGGDGGEATIGGVIATADSGPLRHRYGGPRDLILGITVALSDGTVATAGGKVIKNVAGYDLAKLFTGAFGTLGLIVEVVMRLHPRPRETRTVVGSSDDPDALGAAAAAVAHSPWAPDSLDVSWRRGTGRVIARVAGAAPDAGAAAVGKLFQEAGLEVEVTGADAGLWERQRAGQRSPHGAVVRVSGLPSELPRVVRAAQEVEASVVGRAGLGLSWLTLDDDTSGLVSGIEEVRRRLQPFACVVLDAPGEVKDKVEVWGDAEGVPLMRRVKERFDPSRVCNPGIFVGGI
jgi:glycolate oxidase FAD binding subunit